MRNHVATVLTRPMADRIAKALSSEFEYLNFVIKPRDGREKDFAIEFEIPAKMPDYSIEVYRHKCKSFAQRYILGYTDAL